MIIDVLVPLTLSQIYTFNVPVSLEPQIEVGKRIEVQFGKNRIYAGIVYAIRKTPDTDQPLKDLLAVMDEERMLDPIHLKFWKWISDYYMCSLGEVMIAALPSAFKLSSTMMIAIHPHWVIDSSVLNDNEFMVVEALQIQQKLTIKDVQAILQKQNVSLVIKGLLEKGVLIHWEEIEEKYKPKLENYIYLDEQYFPEDSQRKLFELLAKAPKQEALLLSFYSLGGPYKDVSQKELLKKAASNAGVLNGLLEKGIFHTKRKTVDRLYYNDAHPALTYKLSDTQQACKDAVKQKFESHNVVLLHGITSSGKTQIYIDLITEYLASGKTTLFMLPEIALTTQMIERLRKVFKEKIGVYHSRFNDQERVEIWNKVKKGLYKIILGPRSSLFLPFQDLGLIIVDEEHELSYKQFDVNPHYNARDSAVYLASLFGAKVILGTATPSFETYTNAKLNKYGYVKISERFGGVASPNYVLSDIAKARKEKKMITHFTKELVDEIAQQLAQDKQIILFKNRRGFSPYVVCNTCNSVSKCLHCDVLLTFHKYNNTLRCHYCGYTKPLKGECEVCHHPTMEIHGFGTEKIEDEMQLLFPDAKVGRLDIDTASRKSSFQRIMEDFEDRKIKILIGTQMVAKGLDFSNVGLVGIISADQMLQRLDFRAPERAYQMMVQVAGRAGRDHSGGKVMIQTTEPGHYIFPYIINNQFEHFYDLEMKERKQFFYPPYSKIIGITLKHKNKDLLNEAATFLATQWRNQHNLLILGPTPPTVSFVRLIHIRSIIIKYHPVAADIAYTKSAIRKELELFGLHSRYKSVSYNIDVDVYM